MANNFLQYSSLTYDEIIKQVTDRLNSDERFANFRESAIAQTLVEIFAGTVDIVNYYLERRAEESFFDTARLRSSVILLARSLGYVTQRPIPAEASLKIKLKGDWRDLNLNSNSTVQIPSQSVFSYGGLKFILKNTMTLNFSDYSSILQSNGVETDFILKDYEGNSIDVIQGEIKEKVIEGSTNPQIGSSFQIYSIDDTEFSNRYGEDDYNISVTKVWVGNTKSDVTEYQINRRSLIDLTVIKNSVIGEPTKVCVVRTSISEGVEVLFGDGRFAQYGATTSGQGPQTTFDNIYVQYLATKGSKANQVGAKDKKIQFSGKVYDSNGNDVTSRVDFYFSTNITNGSDMEDIDSIRVNAPNIYYSLDRLVSKDDYINYLKSLTSPINVKNAIAWGEQEELRKRNLEALIRMFNIVFFSVVGPLYQVENSPYFMKTKTNGLDSAVLDYGYDDDSINQRNYFNVFTKGYIENSTLLVEQLKEYQTSTYVWKIKGDEISNTNGVYYSSKFGQNMIFKVDYISDIASNNTKLSGTFSVTADVNSLSGISNDVDAMNALANIIQTKLLTINDTRGVNTFQNTNLNSQAFPGLTVTFDSNTNKFTISHDIDTPAYIYSIGDEGALELKLVSAIPFLVTVDRELSKKIIDVVDDLDSRSQVTIRNIYISPIIQTQKLVGTIYLKDLYDKQSEKTKIENTIYKWFNDNADFNKEIYISNVVELVEQYPSVFYADIRFVPEVPINPTGSNFYVSGSYAPIDNFIPVTYRNNLYTIINNSINNYILNSVIKSDLSASYEKDINYMSTNVQSYSSTWNYNITERTFLEVFAGGLYNTLVFDSNYVDFANSDNFINLISDIRKDYLKIIRYNMIDTVGNIAKDNQLNSDGSSIKGGYSLGCEIVKVNIQLSYEYKR